MPTSKINVLSQLATSLHRRDEEMNIALAKKIASRNDPQAMKELISLLHHKNKDIRNDAIKAVYEAGELNPKLVATGCKELIRLTSHKDNRMVWGSMHALDTITLEKPEAIFTSLAELEKALGCGSVIARDHYVKILSKLSMLKKYAHHTAPLLIEQVRTCPVNQLPMYAEYASEGLSREFYPALGLAIQFRKKEVNELPAKMKRLEKVLKKTAMA